MHDDLIGVIEKGTIPSVGLTTWKTPAGASRCPCTSWDIPALSGKGWAAGDYMLTTTRGEAFVLPFRDIIMTGADVVMPS